jgi:hypothetical protein
MTSNRQSTQMVVDSSKVLGSMTIQDGQIIKVNYWKLPKLDLNLILVGRRIVKCRKDGKFNTKNDCRWTNFSTDFLQNATTKSSHRQSH